MEFNNKQDYPVLGKAPIILAILQIQFKLKEAIDNKSFANLASVREQYPIVNESNLAQLQINPQDQKTPVSLKQFKNGYSYTSKDGSRGFAISNSAFTFQMGSPYKTWDEFSTEALSVWNLCGIENKVESVIRQSIRYVNAFEIKEEKSIIEPSEYFNSYLVVSSNYPDYTRYFFQYTIPLKGNEVIAHVGTEIRESSTNIFPFIFDIDVISLKSVEYNRDVLRETFNLLRQYKNSIFFSSLKEKTINLFK